MMNKIYLPRFLKKILKKMYLKIKYPTLSYDNTTNINLKCIFGKGIKIYNNSIICDSNVDDYTYIAHNSNIVNTSIGKFCSIGPEVLAGLGRHPSMKYMSTHPSFFSTYAQSQIVFADKNYFEETKKIIIGNDVWIGARVTILDGINIGDGAIIGAGAVVTKDVPPYAIVVGVPATIIRYRFKKEQTEKILKLKWWEKDIDWIKKNYQLMHDISNIDTLIDL